MDNNLKNTQIILSDGKNLKIEAGVYAPQANGSVMATIGGTTVLATVVLGELDTEKDYFPLSVEFQDKLYAGGFIKDSRWLKREGGLDDESILLGRIIDRSIRPLFPAGFQNEVQVIVTVLSNDKINGVIIPAFNAVSLALSISDIPFNGSVSATQVGLIGDKLIINPINTQMETSCLDLIVCTGPFGVNMIEAGANIVADDTVLEAINMADQNNQRINLQIDSLVKSINLEKISYQSVLPDPKLIKEIDTLVSGDIDAFFKNGKDDGKHVSLEQTIFEKVTNHYQTQIDKLEISQASLKLAFEEIVKKHIRAKTMDGLRFDGRKMDEIRPITCRIDVLPQVHGSALFQRGLTQALTTVTLGPLSQKQYLNSSLGDKTKRYMHFYNAMPFSTGQTGRVGRPGRREVGHGALAEKALLPVIPSEEKFPYTILVNSEVLSQNGSSSMASTCGSTLSLMAAGVPIKHMVGGVSIGMMSEGDKYILLTDIAGIEDHNGDMDFKITGTKTGITAIQLDVKRPGLSFDMIKDTFKASLAARLKILSAMESAISLPKTSVSPFAPKVALIKLPEDKIGEVIGPGGKMIKALMKKYQVQIDIDDDGLASVSSPDFDNTQNCAQEIENMVREIQIGEEFDGVVTRVEPYGAFVELVAGKEALLHVSELSTGFISDVTKLIKVGDKIHVEVAGRNQENQIKLSAKKFKSEHTGDTQPQRQPQVDSRPSRPFQSRGTIGKFKPPANINKVNRVRRSN